MRLPIHVVHTADLHLGAPFSSLPELSALLKQEQWTVLSRLIAYCAAEKPDVLLIAGDLFDLPVPPSALVNIVRELLDSIPETKVFIASGNHDPAFIDSPYRTAAWPGNVHLFTDELSVADLSDKPVRVLGAGFTAAAATQSLLPPISPLSPAFPKTMTKWSASDRLNLLVLHADLVSRGQSSVYNPVMTDQIEALGIDYAALGHRHERSGPVSAGKIRYAYSGCPMGRGFDETGEKRILSLRFPDDKAQMDSDLVSLGARKFIEQSVSIEKCTSHDDIAAQIQIELSRTQGENWQNHFYRIILTGRSADPLTVNPAILQPRIEKMAVYAEVVDRSSHLPDLALLARENSLRGTFVRLLLEQSESHEQAGTSDQVKVDQLAMQFGLDAFSGEVPERAYT